MFRFYVVLSSVLLSASVGSVRANEIEAAQHTPKSRAFQFDYHGEVTGLPSGSQVRVWLPVPQSHSHQDVELLDAVLPAAGKFFHESKYGNRILFFELTAPTDGLFSFKTSYAVKRREVRTELGATSRATKLADKQRKLFLSANENVPLTGKPLRLIGDVALPTDDWAVARVLYDRVDEHVRYDKSQPGYGRGDVPWVCDSRFGNCTDFHSLFISLARSQGLPARFEIGFPLPPERGKGTIGGYHCWALFYTSDRGWVPVDISEADKHPEMKEYYFGNLTEDRVTFTVGRDIVLNPRQTAPPLNFFVYPHIEVDGRPLNNDQVDVTFSYSDLASE